MAPQTKPSRSAQGSHDTRATPSKNLWVGNLSVEVADSDLMVLFSKYGAVDSITSYPSRSYAFVYFKRVEDARAALGALNGTYLRGNSLKIEFAKPAKPCKSLWVSGISPSVTKEVLEAEFLKFGEIEEFKFLRDRNTAYVDYFRLEDASKALKVMNAKQIGGDQIRVDFLRSQTIRREHGADYRDTVPPDSSWMLQEGITNYSEPTHSGIKRQQHAQSFGGRKTDGQPSNVLWVGYPPTVHVDEQMLHNAFILFGEIESIKSFPSKHYSFVEFRSVDEARRAKEGLQGRLFNDPRISIMFSSSENACREDYPGFQSGVKGPRPDAFFNEPPFQTSHVDMLDHNLPMGPNELSRPATSRGILGPNRGMRPLGPQGSFEPLLSAPDFNNLTVPHKFPDAIPSNMMGGPNWKRSAPIPGMLLSPSQGTKTPIRPVSGTWDVFDANQFQRESKRSRVDNVLVYDTPFPSKKMDDRDWALDRMYGLGPEVDGGASGPVQEKKHFSPAEVRMINQGTGQGHPGHDYIWRGVIAKGGTFVCNARCVAIGRGTVSEIPDVVNCSARTGLDMLTKHYAEAIGCSVVSFLPDSEEDFAPYTEFLRYLGDKSRAGVAKFDDGTTLFLVPPSDFLGEVLQISGAPRLYGVALKFPQNVQSGPSVQPQFFQSQYPDVQEIPPQNDYTGMHQQVENALHMDYNRVLLGETLPSTMQLGPSTKDSIPMHPVPPVNVPSVSQAGVTLTPELIATLASLIPSSAKSSDPETAQPSVGPSSVRPELGIATLPQGWTHDRHGYEQIGHSLHQVENQYNSTGQQIAQPQIYSTGVNTSSDSTMGVTGNSQVQDHAFHTPPQGVGSSRPLNNYGMPSQRGQLAVPPQVDRHYQYEVHQNVQKGFGMAHGTDSGISYSSSAYNEPSNSVALSTNQVNGSSATLAHTAMPFGADKGNAQLLNQGQQFQSAANGGSQGALEAEVDKNQRYQSTLQFAANLLFQIQQQQQTNSQVGQGSANQ